MKILSASVHLCRRGSDIVNLETDLPSPTPKVDNENLYLRFRAEKGTGIQYLKEHFNIEPKVYGDAEIDFKFGKA